MPPTLAVFLPIFAALSTEPEGSMNSMYTAPLPSCLVAPTAISRVPSPLRSPRPLSENPKPSLPVSPDRAGMSSRTTVSLIVSSAFMNMMRMPAR